MSEHILAEKRALPQRKVYSVKVSPLNPKCWHVTLECGHSHWITQKTRPKLKTKGCGPCRDGVGSR